MYYFKQHLTLHYYLLHLSYHSQDRHYEDEPSLWVSTTDSALKNWSLAPSNLKKIQQDGHPQSTYSDNCPILHDQVINQKPTITIKGNPAIVSYHVLNDRRHILTRGSDRNIALYDVLTARKVEQVLPAHVSNNPEVIF